MSVKTEKIDVAGLLISPVTKKYLLEQIRERVKRKEKTFIVTPYSEFLHASLHKPELKSLFNSADFAIADGIGILWANLYLSVPLTLKYFYLNALQAWWQVIWTGASILLRPSLLYKNIPEKIVGADFVWDLAQLAADNDFKIFLLGARGDVAERAGKKLKEKFPNVNIVGTSNKDMTDSSVLDDINAVSPDMLLVAFKAQAAEKWIADNLSKTTASLGIGLGGTFDYLAGEKSQPPRLVRNAGLEWLWRLFTQPSRVVRIYNAFWGLIISLIRYKTYLYAPFRANGCAVVINQQGKFLLCKRVPGPEKNSGYHLSHFDDYWQFPQGGLDRNEGPVEGTKRELLEETGIKTVDVIGQAKFLNEYLWNNARRSLVTSRYKYKGQSQYTIFFKFNGTDEEVKLDDHELDAYEWLTAEEVMKKIAPERRRHAEAVLAELKGIQL